MGHIMAKIIIFENEQAAQDFCDVISSRLANALGVEMVIFDVPHVSIDGGWWCWSPSVDFTRFYPELVDGLSFDETDYPISWVDE